MVGVVVADKELSSRTYNTGSGGRFHFLLNYSFLFRSAHPPISTNQHLVAMFCSYFVYIVVLVEHSHCAAPSGGVGVDGNLPRTPLDHCNTPQQNTRWTQNNAFAVILGLLVSFFEKLKRDSKIK